MRPRARSSLLAPWLLLGALATPAAATPQRGAAEGPRRPAFGRVLDRDGAPVQGLVTLASQARFGPAERPADVVQVETDVRGRFVAQLLVGAGYSAWATRPRGGRRYAASAVRDVVAAGAFVELRLVFDREQRPVRVVGARAGPFDDALRVQLVPAAANDVPFDLDERGLSPRLPTFGGALLCASDGAPLCSVMPRRVDGEWRVELPPVQALRLRVARADGQPVTGARAFARVRLAPAKGRASALFRRPVVEVVRELATCAPGGSELQVMAPAPQHWGSLLFVGADGCAPEHVLLPQPGSGPLDVVLRPAATLTVRPHDPARQLWLSASWGHGPGVRSARLLPDGEGRCVVPLHGEPMAAVLTTWQASAGAAARRDARAEPAFMRLWWTGGAAYEMNLLRLRRVPFQVMTPDGGPASGVPFAVLSGQCKSVDLHTQPLFTDQAGRGAVWLDDEAWSLVACDGSSLGVVDLAPGGEVEPVRVRMAPMARARLRLLDAARRPLVGRRVLSATGRGLPGVSMADRVAILASSFACEQVDSGRDGYLELPFVPGASAVVQVPPLATRIPLRVSATPDDVTEVIVTGR